jgi:uncharacterized protein with PIN domain
MARFYLDEDINEKLAAELEARGHDVKTTTGSGNKGASDPDQLKFAASENRIIITNNRDDFEEEHAKSGGHGGIISGNHDRTDRFASNVDNVVSNHPDLSNTCVRAQKERYVVIDKSGDKTVQNYVDREAGQDPARNRAAAKWAARAPPEKHDATQAADTPQRADKEQDIER